MGIGRFIPKSVKTKVAKQVKKFVNKRAVKEYHRIVGSNMTDDLIAMNTAKEAGISRYRKTGKDSSLMIGINQFTFRRAQENTIKALDAKIRGAFSKGLYIASGAVLAKEKFHDRKKT